MSSTLLHDLRECGGGEKEGKGSEEEEEGVRLFDCLMNEAKKEVKEGRKEGVADGSMVGEMYRFLCILFGIKQKLTINKKPVNQSFLNLFGVLCDALFLVLGGRRDAGVVGDIENIFEMKFVEDKNMVEKFVGKIANLSEDNSVVLAEVIPFLQGVPKKINLPSSDICGSCFKDVGVLPLFYNLNYEKSDKLFELSAENKLFMSYKIFSLPFY
jgi:hypothetical protein